MAEQAGSASDPEARAVFERCLHLGLSGDHNGQADLYAVDGVLEFPLAPPGVPRRVEGREEIRRVLVALGRQASTTGVRIDEAKSSLVVHETREPGVVVVEIEAHGEVAATGDTFVRSYIQVYRVRGGLIASMRDYWPAEVGENLKPMFATT